MTHTETIWVVVTLCFASTFGVYAAIRVVKQYTRPPMNMLNRQSADIELGNIIEPVRPQEIYDPSLMCSPDLSLHTQDRFYIQSSFENSINLDLFDFLIAIILGFLFFFLVNYYILKFSETECIFTNGISTNIITFTENYQEILRGKLGNDTGYLVCFKKMYWVYLTPKWTIFDINSWLETLEEEQDYSVIIEVIANDSDISDKPRILLTREFIVNYKSNPVLISKFISEQLNILWFLFDIKIENHLLLIHYASLKPVN